MHAPTGYRERERERERRERERERERESAFSGKKVNACWNWRERRKKEVAMAPHVVLRITSLTSAVTVSC